MKLLQTWVVSGGTAAQVVDDDGVTRTVTIPGNLNPTDEQIVAAAVAASPARVLVGTTKAALVADRNAKYAEWRQAKDARAECITRGGAYAAWAAGNGLTFETNTWNAYVAAVQAWAAAA